MNLNIFRPIIVRIGIDKSIAYTSGARIIQAVASLFTIFFIAHSLSGEEQGYYYTFGSIVAIQIFFELGLCGIITQYVAHEASHLKWEKKVILVGDEKYQSRLSSLFHFCIKWYGVFSIALFITLLLVGFLFFTRYQYSDGVSWNFPWILLSMGTALNLFMTPIFSYLEGLNKVKEVARIRFFQQLIAPFLVWICLLGGGKLFAVCINSYVIFCLSVYAIFFTDFKKILWSIWKKKITCRINYKKEIFPYQWRIALSWISGYFIFQLFNPVLFASEGAVVAGQMGMTLQMLNGIQALSLSWISTKVPVFSSYIAQHSYRELDILFNRTLKQSVFVNGLGLLTFLLLIFVIRSNHVVIGDMDLESRFLSYLPMIWMMIPLFVNQFVNAWATYLRCHKQEPFLYNSIVAGILCCTSTVFLGKYYGVMGVTSGYCIITVLMFFWGYWIFKTKKHEWHK